MKLIFLKSFWSKIKKIRIEDILQILLVTAVALIIITFINPHFTGPYFGKGNKLPLTTYFDIFIRYGTFIFIYFTLIPILILWLAKKCLKEKWSSKKGLLFLIASLFLLTVIFFVMPGSIYGNPLNVPWFKSSPSDTSEKFKKIEETGLEFCENRIDFFYSSCSLGLKPSMETLKNELEFKKSSVKLYIWCAGKDETSCEEYKNGLYPRGDVINLGKKYNVKTLPATIIGCKYNMRGVFELEDYKQFICEKLNECGL